MTCLAGISTVMPQRYPLPLGTIEEEGMGVLYQEILLLICLLQHSVQCRNQYVWTLVCTSFFEKLQSRYHQDIVADIRVLYTMATDWIQRLRE